MDRAAIRVVMVRMLGWAEMALGRHKTSVCCTSEA
jgi:hypothetical protein